MELLMFIITRMEFREMTLFL